MTPLGFHHVTLTERSLTETSKMRARKSLMYAREAIDKFSDRNRMRMYVEEVSHPAASTPGARTPCV